MCTTNVLPSLSLLILSGNFKTATEFANCCPNNAAVHTQRDPIVSRRLVDIAYIHAQVYSH